MTMPKLGKTVTHTITFGEHTQDSDAFGGRVMLITVIVIAAALAISVVAAEIAEVVIADQVAHAAAQETANFAGEIVHTVIGGVKMTFFPTL